MEPPRRPAASEPADRTQSIELLVAALLGRPTVQRPRHPERPRYPATAASKGQRMPAQPEEKTMGFTYTNSKGQAYGLHSRTTTSGSGRSRTLYYFSKTIDGAIDDVPPGYQVVEAKTGLPLLKKLG